jgi:hypothetical protein
MLTCKFEEDGALDKDDLRPPVWVGHVLMETDRLDETSEFMQKLGMRPIVLRPEVAVLELRGGTHLVLIAKSQVTAGDASFDLMVEDIHASHAKFVELGLNPTPIDRISREHEGFKLTEPAGHIITFFSNHVSGPV